MRVLAVDPGGVHCGMAAFDDGVCIKAWELPPSGCIKWVEDNIDTLDVLVIEEFRLYADKAMSQVGGTIETVEVIGVLKYIWARFGEARGTKLVLQGASIKKPTVKILGAKKIRSVAKQDKAGGHAFDAETHGYHYIMKQERKTK